MADTASIHIDASKAGEGVLDEEAFGDAVTPKLAALVQVFVDFGFARPDILLVNSVNDENVRHGTGEDFDEV
jgi:hypothetical protein